MFQLKDGNQIPLVGFGTFQLRSNKDKDLVLKTLDVALENGYRLIDTASCYRNEHDIGTALQTLYTKHSLTRKDLFITSKVAPKEMGYTTTIASCMKTLKDLQTDYLDLYLIHWPGAAKLKPDDDQHASYRKLTWQAFQDLQKQGYVKSIGVSNFTQHHLEELLQYATARPVVNQVEFHPHLYQKDLLEYCRRQDIFLQAYSSLGTGKLINDEKIDVVSEKHKTTNSQVLLKWSLQQNVGVLPKSTNPEHIRTNFDLSSSTLDESDMNDLNSLHNDIH